MCNVKFVEPVISVKTVGISRDVLIDLSSASNLISKDTLLELKYQRLKIGRNLAQRHYMLMGVESLELKASFSQTFPYRKQR